MKTQAVRKTRWIRRLVRASLALACVLILLAIVAVFVPEPALAPPTSIRLPALTAADSAHTFAVYVADYGYHTAIFVEQPPAWSGTHTDAAPDGGGTFVEYAWGDRRFYMESRFAPWSVFATLLLPTEAVAYVAHHRRPPDQLRRWRALHSREVTADEMRALTLQLERWIERDDVGARRRAFPAVPGYRGRFYRAYGRYSWWQNCNRWTLRQLAVIGASRERSLVVTPSQVLSHLQRFVPVRASRSSAAPTVTPRPGFGSVP